MRPIEESVEDDGTMEACPVSEKNGPTTDWIDQNESDHWEIEICTSGDLYEGERALENQPLLSPYSADGFR